MRNTGNTTLNGIELSDTLLVAPNPVLACTPIDSLAPGDTAQFSCTNNIYTVSQADVDTGSTDFEPGDGQIDNLATATATVAGTDDTIDAEDRNEVNLPVRTPGISLVKQADVSSVAAPLTINYSFLVSNSGNVTLENVTVTDRSCGGILSNRFTTVNARREWSPNMYCRLRL